MTLTLRKLLIVCAVTPVMASAQVPPKPAPSGKPVPTPKVRVRIDPEFEWHFDDLKWQADEMRLHALEMSKLDVERLRQTAEEMKLFVKPDVDMFKVQAELKALTKINTEEIRWLAEEAVTKVRAELPMKLDMDFRMDLPKIEGVGVGLGWGAGGRDRFLEARPAQGWASQDPADSLYRVAREALNRGEYRRAAQTFNEITKKYPRSQYALSSAYWEAFARYRNGGTEDLREALKILNEKSAQFTAMDDHGNGNVDVQALRTRVLGALASRGDAGAAEELRKNASQSSSCDREDVSVRAEALSALGQMDMAAAMPSVRKVLQRRDECTVELRRRAVYLIARQPTSEAIGLLLDVARNDTNASIRSDAMRALPRVAGDSAVPYLEELLRTASEEQSQRAAISALGSIDSDRARRAVRTIIERPDASERIRSEAILSLSRERDGRMLTPDEVNYLRSLYGKLEAVRLREAVLTSVGRIGSPESELFLMAVARNVNEPPSLRATALQRLGRMTTVSVDGIAKLYDVADSRAMREQILNALAQRKENEAIDKMIEIAKKDTDPQIRRAAINHLYRSNNEKAKQFLQELFK
ncbi:MAG: HEAT repeat domain-containing protein [Gemmatimonadaceae bacterium]